MVLCLLMLVSGISRIAGGFVIFRVPPLVVSHGSMIALGVLFTLLFGWSNDTLGSFTWGFAFLFPLCAMTLIGGLLTLKARKSSCI